MGEGKPKRKLRNFLLDRRFQLKYTLAVVLISALISAGLGTLLYQAHRETSRVSALDDPDLDGALAAELAEEDRQVIYSIVAFLGGLVLALSALGIVATHKIAGPAYAMRRTLSQIADGKLPQVRALRKGDELRSVSEELRRMANNLREREELEVEKLHAVLSGLEAQDAGKASSLLKELVEAKAKRLD
ncbi:MAG: hypothetical protein JXR96_17700 [Deltaproteobacteria bacterium]|nr:hypothetical protein [Deltaproteobacteria bacterium]